MIKKVILIVLLLQGLCFNIFSQTTSEVLFELAGLFNEDDPSIIQTLPLLMKMF